MQAIGQLPGQQSRRGAAKLEGAELSALIDKKDEGVPRCQPSSDQHEPRQTDCRAAAEEGQIVSERELTGGTELDGGSQDRRRLCRPNDKDAFVRSKPTSLSALPTLTRRSSRSLSQPVVVAHADPQGLDLVAFGLPADAPSCAGSRRR